MNIVIGIIIGIVIGMLFTFISLLVGFYLSRNSFFTKQIDKVYREVNGKGNIIGAEPTNNELIDKLIKDGDVKTEEM